MAPPHGRPWPTQRSLNWVWDVGTLDWVMETQPTGGGGGGAVTLADGADTTEGTIADAAVTGDNPGTVNAHLRGVTKDLGDPTDAEAAGNGSIIAILKRIRTLLASPLAVSGPLTDAQLRASAVPVSGNWLTDAQLRATPVPVSGSFGPTGTLSTGNSSTTPLAGGGLFTGTAVDCLNFTYIEVNVFADVASDTSGLSFNWSTDNVNFHLTRTSVIPAGTFRTFYAEPKARYLRIDYSNGVSAQAVFRLQTILNGGAVPAGQVTDSSFAVSSSPVGEMVQLPTAFVVYDGVPPGAGGTGRLGMPAMTNVRAIHSNLRSAGGEIGIQYSPVYTRMDPQLSGGGVIVAVAQAASAVNAVWSTTPGVLVEISDVFVGTLEFQSNPTGVGFSAVAAVNLATGVVSTTTTVPGKYLIQSGQSLRVLSTAWTSGSATVGFTNPWNIQGTWVTGPLTDAQLRASAVSVAVSNFPGTQPVSLADGADVTEGALADAAVITDTTGTISGKLRGLVKWAFERMPASLGQKSMAASLPVTTATDQKAGILPFTTTTWTTATPNGTNVDFDVEGMGGFAIDILFPSTITAGSIAWFASVDGVVFSSLQIPWGPISSGATFNEGPRSSISGTGVITGFFGNVNTTAYKTIRVTKLTTFTGSGNVTVKGAASQVPGPTGFKTYTIIKGDALKDVSTYSATHLDSTQVLAAEANAANPTRSEGAANPLSVNLSGQLRTILPLPATPVQSSVSVTLSSTPILAANVARLGATIFNESGAIAYVKLGATASLTSYTAQIAIGGYYEVPFGYTGAIDGITVAVTAVLRVTELTA